MSNWFFTMNNIQRLYCAAAQPGIKEFAGAVVYQ